MRKEGSLIWIAIFFCQSVYGAVGSHEIFSALKKKAIEKSYDIQLAQQNVAKKQAQLSTSWSHWIPRVDLRLSQMRSRDFSILSGGALGALSTTIQPQTLSLVRWDLNLAVPLYRRSIHLDILQSLAEGRLAEGQLNLLLTELDWKLRSLFGNYLLSSYRVTAVDSSIEVARSHLKEVRFRFELGQRAKLDILRSEANLAFLKTERLSYLEQQSIEFNRLLEYSGLTPADILSSDLSRVLNREDDLSVLLDQFTHTEELFKKVAPFLGNQVEALEKQIVDFNPSYHNALAEAELSRLQAQNLTVQEWPDLSLQGSFNKQAPDWNNAWGSSNRSYNLSLVLNIPLFSGGSIFSSWSEKRHTEASAELKKDKDILQLRNEIENEKARILSFNQSLEAQKLNVEQNKEILRLTQKSYQLGKATITDLLSSQNDLTQVKIKLAQAKVDFSQFVRRFAWNIGIYP